MTERTLICITSCKRLKNIILYAPDFINFCNKNASFHFLIALDGYEQEYIDFCKQNQIPLIYSDEREGVGLSKNRVLLKFPDFDFYFFVEDDVELVDEQVFKRFINVYKLTQINHISSYPLYRNKYLISTKSIQEFNIIYSKYGSAQVNFFSSYGLKKVGGWHTKFAETKRFGHTEHTYRFYNQGLTPAPFNIIEECNNMFRWHEPETITKFNPDIIGESGLAKIEEELIKEKLQYFPVKTISDYYFNNVQFGKNDIIEIMLGQKYSSFSSCKFLKNRFLTSQERNRLTSERAFEYAIDALKNRKFGTFLKELFVAILFCRNLGRLAVFIYYPSKLIVNKVIR